MRGGGESDSQFLLINPNFLTLVSGAQTKGYVHGSATCGYVLRYLVVKVMCVQLNESILVLGLSTSVANLTT